MAPKRERDGEPKRPAAAWKLFAEEKKTSLTAEQKALTALELNKLLKDQYSGLPDKKKKKYERLEAFQTIKYQKALAEYIELNPQSKFVAGRTKTEKGPKSSKPPRKSPYFLFVNEIRQKYKEKYPDETYREFVIRAAKKWNSLPQSEKHKYQELARELNEHIGEISDDEAASPTQILD